MRSVYVAMMAGCLLAGASAGVLSQTFVVNGKPAQVATVVKSGKIYADAAALARALGATVSFDKARNRFTITLPSAAAKVGGQETGQMAGEWAEIGKEYALDRDDPMSFALRGAEFVASRVRIGDEAFFPKANEKLLLLHYTIHNPQKSERSASWNSFDLTAVDSTNANREYSQEVGQEANRLPLGSMSLKPAQKVEVYTFIVVPAAGEVPKLIVKRGEGAVLRYDLRGKVKALVAPFADPADASGCTAVRQITGVMGTYYPTGLFDVRVEAASCTDQSFLENEVEEGTRHLLVSVSVRNETGEPQSVYWSTFRPSLICESGDAIEYNEYLLHPTRDEKLRATVQPGQETKARFFFPVRDDDPAKTLVFREGPESDGNRAFTVGLSTVK